MTKTVLLIPGRVFILPVAVYHTLVAPGFHPDPGTTYSTNSSAVRTILDLNILLILSTKLDL